MSSPIMNLKNIVRPYMKASYSRALWQLGSTSLAYGFLLYLMHLSLHKNYFITLLLSIPTSGIVMRLFIIQHDCGHQSFFKKKWQNDLLGTCIGILTLTPYEYWHNQHAIHHATTGNLEKRGNGDVFTLTVKEYENADKIKRIWYRIYRNPIFLFFIGTPLHFLFLQRLPLGFQFKNPRSWISVMITNIAIVSLVILFAQFIGLGGVLFIYLPVITFSAIAGGWFFYVQHQFEDAYWRDSKSWNFDEASIQGSSYYNLPKILNWFTGNIGFHHIHHLNSKIPNYRLQKCYKENPILQKAPEIKFWKSFKTMRLALWDEQKKKMISFSELKKKYCQNLPDQI